MIKSATTRSIFAAKVHQILLQPGLCATDGGPYDDPPNPSDSWGVEHPLPFFTATTGRAAPILI